MGMSMTRQAIVKIVGFLTIVLGFPALSFAQSNEILKQKDARERISRLEGLVEIGELNYYCEIGEVYLFDLKDTKSALRNFEKGAAAQQALCQVFLGDYYFTEAVDQDKHQIAAKWYEMSIVQNNKSIQKERGNKKNKPEALEMFISDMNVQIAHAKSRLGFMYRKGLGVPQDDQRALSLFRDAASMGNAEAQFNLGGMYALGQGVAVDMREARKWMRKAADGGNAGATKWLVYTDAAGQ